ncbi:hypothetical protein [Kineosporia mesophila]|uniref:hypothetical protein n=1 Tax=Kineosporia mesophila TaxID=566012 RepID=UPI001E4DE7AA|nr:hypothetical protein [Kineosporia mesophila]MCD5351335.1 hypothetical protein [Kineosporia mesophila]
MVLPALTAAQGSRMLELGLVEEREILLGGTRRTQAFPTTPAGEERLRQWVAQGALDEPAVPAETRLRPRVT